MKLNDYIKLGKKNFETDKRKYISIILLTICSILIIISISFSSSIKKYWNNTAKNLVDFRTYFVEYDTSRYTEEQAIEKLKKYKHVSGVSKSSSYIITMIANEYVNSDMDGTIYLEGTSRDGINTVLGNNLTKSNNINEIVCAKQFYPKIEENMSDYDLKNTVDLSDKVGKNISMSFLGQKQVNEQFKLIGLYDARENFTEGNICYATFETIDKLNQKYQKDVFDDENSEYPLIMVIDSIDSKDVLLKEISKDGFYFDEAMMRINPNIGDQIINISSYGAFFIIILTIIISIIFIIKDFEDNKNYYSILKSFGYQNINISIIKYISDVIIGIISFVNSIFLSILVILFIKKVYFVNKLMYINIDFHISFISLIISLLICLFIPFLIFTIFNYKNYKTDIINEIK